MAMLLNITRAQWSMYESGKRSLPSIKILLLAEMMAHVQSKETAKAAKTIIDLQQNENRELFEKMLRENEFQQMILQKKIEAATRKNALALRLSHLSDFGHNGKIMGVSDSKLEYLRSRASGATTVDSNTLLAELEIKLEVLQFECGLLKAKLA